ncbi:MAG: dihydrofolate reductase family protein, partial [Chitinophagaceae bacterium]|nr:dihydrofolate reductase family protein [Chitinophagaceae bacterium]
DWMEENWDEELKDYVNELTAPVDTILLGRKLAEVFIPYWSSAALNPDNPEFNFAKKMNATPKIVFSRTLKNLDTDLPESKGANTRLAKKGFIEEITELKKQGRKTERDIILYGGAHFVSEVIKYGLIDEYHLFINPVALGSGLTIFQRLEKRLNLKLVYSRPFDCGIVAFHYQPE